MKKILLLASILFLMASCCENATGPVSLFYDDDALAKAKNAVQKSDPAIMPVFNALTQLADNEYLTMEPLSVAFKTKVAPSNDPRDYISLSPYWWADPDSKDGLPYIRRDGERNPEVYDYPERENSYLFGKAVRTLSVLYYITDNEKYAEKAAELLRVWFLDPVTGINPNMVYSQIRPGHTEYRGTGIIDSRRFIYALDGARLIGNSPSWTEQDRENLQAWSAAFLYWLENSSFGRMEHEAPNNHGLWYETIRLMTIMYTGNYDYAANVIATSFAPRFESQMEPDGSLPHELERTLGLHYSTFAIEAALLTARMGKKSGYDLWAYTSPGGRSLRQAVEFVYPYYMNEKEWPYMQISPFETERGAVVLYEAGVATGNQEWIDAAHTIGYNKNITTVDALLYYHLVK